MSDLSDKFPDEKKIQKLKKKLNNNKEQAQFLQHITDTLPAIAYLFDIEELKMIWCNKQHKEFIGFDTTGMNLMDQEGGLMKIYKSDQNIALENIEQWRRAAIEPGKVVIRLTGNDKQHEYFYTDHEVFKKDQEGNPRWILGIGINIDRKKHSEHEKRVLYSEDIAKTYQYLEQITDKELEILELLSDGNSYQEIADTLNLSVDGVRYHIRKLYKILEVNTRVEAVKIALKYRLIIP